MEANKKPRRNMAEIVETCNTLMPRQLGKIMLTAHITVSVGWLGAVAGFLVLSIAALTSRNVSIVRGAYLSMNLIGLYLLVPLSFAALLTGLVQSLGSAWGLFRQYWTIVKLVLTFGSVGLLLLHQFMEVERVALRVTASPAGTMPQVSRIGSDLALKAVLAMVVLLITTTLSVYKPWGLTSYGRRLQQKRRGAQSSAAIELSTALANCEPAPATSRRTRLMLFLALSGLLIVGLVLMHHLFGQGIRSHGF